MNYCNFAKVILSRCSKDTSAINWFTNRNKENEEYTSTFNTSLSLRQRHQNYMTFMEKYPNMQINYDDMKKKMSRIQTYLTKSKYWLWEDAQTGKQDFLKNFSLFNWTKLTEEEKKKHQLLNCDPCSTTHIETSSAHKSASQENVKLKNLCQEVTDQLLPKTPIFNRREAKKHGNQAVAKVLTTLKPIVENRLDIDFDTAVTKSLKLSPNLPKKAQQTKEKNLVRNKKDIETQINTDDTNILLASGKSFAETNRQRLATFFVSRDDARLKTHTRIAAEGKRRLRKKKHHGNFSNYSFDKDRFLEEIRSRYSGAIVNWTALARKYDLKINNKIPSNAGQILSEFAKSNGINIFQFNPHTRLSGRDYQRRVRRSIKRIGKSRVSVPTPRSGKKIRNDVEKKKDSGEINPGIPVAPKTFTKQVIGPDGTIVTKTKDVYARKIPFDDIRNKDIERFQDEGILRYFTDQQYAQLTDQELNDRFKRIQEPCPASTEMAIEQLKSLERTRHLKLWHDHSDILGFPHVSFMVSWIYDPANFLTDEEYMTLYPEKKPVSIQTIVERPSLYMLGQSSCSDKDQMMYVDTRLEDIQELKDPIYIKSVPTYDVVRIFSGDGPARQFESGHKRGGNFRCLCRIHAKEHTNLECCLRHPGITLDERQDIVMKGVTYMKKKNDTVNPFNNLKKKELITELASRGVGTLGLTKSELETTLIDILKGVQRLPALMSVYPSKSLEEINCKRYEVMQFEPLHDITNIVQHLITELPYHLGDARQDYEIFRNNSIGDKTQIKGTNARKYAIQLVTFTKQQFEDNKVDKKVLDLANCLVEVISICYSRENTRSPKQILRLYNQTFLFSVLCRDIIGKPEKLNSGRFYGTHFHTTTTHAAETARLICLRSILTENEERGFQKLSSISEHTSNRQSNTIIENALIRFPAMQKQSEEENSFQQQESEISKLHQLLPSRGRSVFPASILKKTSLYQAHLERIADFLVVGEGIWWKHQQDDILFLDGPDDPSFHMEGPPLHHFRSSNLKEERIYTEDLWQMCVDEFQNNKISLPLDKVRVYENGKLHFIRQSELPSTPANSDNQTIIPEVPIQSNSNTICEDQIPSPDSDTICEDQIPSPDHKVLENSKDNREIIHSSIFKEFNMAQQPFYVQAVFTTCFSVTLNLGKDNEEIKRQYREYINDMLKESSVENDAELSIIRAKRTAAWCLLHAEPTSSPERKAPKRKLIYEDNYIHQKRGKTDHDETYLDEQNVHKGIHQASTTELVERMLGKDTNIVQEYLKYRRILQQHPNDSSIRAKYEKAKAVVGFQILAKLSQMKINRTTDQPSNLEEQLEILLKRWNISTKHLILT